MNMMQQSKVVSPTFIGRWTPKILFSLKERPYRHGSCAGISEPSRSACLPRTLRNLEATGLIVRRVTRAKAMTVEYSLTRLGKTIIAPLPGMCHWAKRYHKRVTADVHLPEAYEVQ
jgi:DNA-binding HxlR family transcriptional regulator